MSAGLWDIEVARTIDRKDGLGTVRSSTPDRRRWNPGRYSEGQIRGLVRQVFFSAASPVLRQVVFARIDCQTNVEDLVRRVSGILAESSSADIAVVEDGEFAMGCHQTDNSLSTCESSPLKRIATEVQARAWLLPAEPTGFGPVADYWSAIRRDFEYSILVADCGAQSHQVATMARADGVVLVLSARHTRRAAARRIKQRLDDARVRLLGTVLMDREFPIPEGIYRRL